MMKSWCWLAYQSNVRQAVAIRGREQYYSLRSSIRQLRRSCPTHYNVMWYADSLGIDQWSDRVVTRHIDWGYVAASGITGPVGKLP